MSKINPSNEYRASIDLQNATLKPMIHEDQIRMMYDSAASVTANGGLHKVIKKGDNIYIAHDEGLYVNQTTASKAVKVNPFAVTIFTGNIDLSPSSDEWRDVERLPDKIVPGGSTISRRPAYLFNNHIYDWCGTTGSEALSRVVTNESILTLIEDRVIESVLSHFMRARKVFFKASGLRPNTRVFTFLDGNNITSLTNAVSGPSGFQFYSSTDSDFGNTLKNITTHPDGASTLETDGDGVISGSFIVPNNDTTKIRTGTKQFKILDISVDNEKDAAVISSAPYTASGFIDTKQAEYSSTRIIYRPYQYYDNQGGDNVYPPGSGYTLVNTPGGQAWISNKSLTLENGMSRLGSYGGNVQPGNFSKPGNTFANFTVSGGTFGAHTYSIGTDLANDNSDDHDDNHSNPSDPSHSDPTGGTYT
jgi:hypothetical protein